MYRVYRKIPDPFQGDLEFGLKNVYFRRISIRLMAPFLELSLMMRGVSHVCLKLNLYVVMCHRFIIYFLH